jgi:hypothetical protein
MRVLVSNSISIPVDSVVFCWLAFGGVYPASVVWGIFQANVLLKGAVTVLSLPIIYLVRKDRMASTSTSPWTPR